MYNTFIFYLQVNKRVQYNIATSYLYPRRRPVHYTNTVTLELLQNPSIKSLAQYLWVEQRLDSYRYTQFFFN